ncbi:MAG: nucleoside triphosphate pyrophosphohydrolase [Chloroflexi bacterium]|nr:nucleoside triphosphate pyrophosphohydrolase [Chloroflexota bacterium]
MITIIGLGPGSIKHLTLGAWTKLQQANTLYLRTSRHPCVAELPAGLRCVSFDDVYEAHEQFDQVYSEIAARVLDLAQRDAEVLYAVPGDPHVGEASVAKIIEAARAASIDVDIIPGLSFIEPCLSLLGIDALNGLQIVDALSVAAQYHPPINPSLPALVGQVYSRDVASDLKLTLMNQYPDEFSVKLVHSAGNDDEHVETLPLFEIDHSRRIDIKTALYLPPLGELCGFEALQNIIAHLRSPEGCPWDREQTHKSLRPFLIEEAYEVLESLDAGDPDALCKELGDLLLQILLHTQIAIDEGDFNMADVLRHLNEKMIHRHPHVWGDAPKTGDFGQLSQIWQEAKAAERADTDEKSASILDGIPNGAPALFVAQRYSARAAKVGFDWADVAGVEEKFKEELAEVFSAKSRAQRANEIGDLIFVLVNWLRWLGVDDPESLLREINAKFYRRFRHVETRAVQAGKPLSDFTLDELERWWGEAKRLGL